MDKKSKEALRRYKKARQAQSSSDSSSSDSDSESSSSDSSSSSAARRAERHRKKKARLAASNARRASSTSADERRRREKRDQYSKLEAKRDHIKRKLKEAKLKKRAAEAAAALAGHSHRALSPATQAKLKKLAERKHARAVSKERREREREKRRAAAREHDRDHHRSSRSPKTKMRLHLEAKRQKSPPPRVHQLITRENIIIQTRNRDRTPSEERERLQHKMLARERERRERDRERAEREAARDKERAEALARCQERQRERERLAREKLRREEEEKKYADRGERLMPRQADRSSRGYSSRERSMDSMDRSRHLPKRDVDVFDREREFLDVDRRGGLDHDHDHDLRREREFMGGRRRDISPVGSHYSRARDPREVFPEDERERSYSRGYPDEPRHARERPDAWMDIRELREREMRGDPREYRELEHDVVYPDERERMMRDLDRKIPSRGADWKGSDWSTGPPEREWQEEQGPPTRVGVNVFSGGPKRGGGPSQGPPKLPPREARPPSEPDWDADEIRDVGIPKPDPVGPGVVGGNGMGMRDGPMYGGHGGGQRDWMEHDQRDKPPMAMGRPENNERRWQPHDWRENEEMPPQRGVGPAPIHHHPHSERGGRGGYRGRGGGGMDHGDRGPPHGFRPHHPSSMMTPGGYRMGSPRFPAKRNMTYTNPNLLKKPPVTMMGTAKTAAAQASAVAAATTAVAAAKAAAQSAAGGSTNPGILAQVSQVAGRPSASEEKPEAGEIVGDGEDSIKTEIETKTREEAKEQEADISIPVTAAAKPQVAACVLTDKASGELSEISDSEDDILNKAEKKAKTDVGEEEAIKSEVASNLAKVEVNASPAPGAIPSAAVSPRIEPKVEDDEMLDFEEISDGELEEEARHKGVGDALGVDWASLIAETKKQAESFIGSGCDQWTTAKQKWQAHRIILDVGISMRMAGEEYAKRLLSEAQSKLEQEVQGEKKVIIKTENSEETPVVSIEDEGSQEAESATSANANEDPDEKKCLDMKVLPAKKMNEETDDEGAINIDRLHPIACAQVAERRRKMEQHQMIANICGPNSRALSARQDLKLRRQLCGLPPVESDLPRSIPPVSEKLKAMALAAFQRTFAVK